MDAVPKAHQNFHIELHHPPGHVFSDGETVSGACVLFSTHDEDVAHVSVLFQGLLKTHVEIPPKIRSDNNIVDSQYNSERVLFTSEAIVHEGPAKLARNIRYAWPFQFRFQDLELPSATYYAGRGNATIEHTLKASRGKPWQDPGQITRRLDARNHLRGAPFQPSKILEKLAPFLGAVEIVQLRAFPRPRGEPDLSLQVLSSTHNPHSGGLSGLLHRHQEPTDPASSFTLDISIPRSLIRGQPLPVILVIRSSMQHLPETHMRSISIILVTSVVVRTEHNTHHNTAEDKISLLEMHRQKLPLPNNTPVELGRMVGCMFQVDVLPGFACDLLEVSYSLKIEVGVECGGKSYEGKHRLEGVKIY